jgi:competence protein ComEA
MMLDDHKKVLFAIGFILFIGSVISIYKKHRLPASAVIPLSNQRDRSPTFTPPQVWVHIAGAVQNPGLYEVDPEMRTATLLEKAGGVLPNANLDRINLAKRIKDGSRIFVPEKKSAEPKKQSRKQIKTHALFSINTATAAQLRTLPGIGPKLAKRILKDREENGPFHKISDLTRIKGIGARSWRRLSPFITN